MKTNVIVSTLVVAGLGACTGRDSGFQAMSYDTTASIRPVTGALNESPSQAVSAPPTLGAVTRVKDDRFANGGRQTLTLDGDGGWNVIELSVQTRPREQGRFDQLEIYKPSESGIRTEILNRFPNMKMGVVSRPARNAHGPIGIAVGKRADGARCLFAWQWIDDASASDSAGWLQMAASLSARSNPASLRVRVCRKDHTLDDLAAAVEAVGLIRGPALSALVNPSLATGATVAVNGRLVTPMTESLENAVADVGPGCGKGRAPCGTSAPQPEASKPQTFAARPQPAVSKPVPHPHARPAEIKKTAKPATPARDADEEPAPKPRKAQAKAKPAPKADPGPYLAPASPEPQAWQPPARTETPRYPVPAQSDGPRYLAPLPGVHANASPAPAASQWPQPGDSRSGRSTPAAAALSSVGFGGTPAGQ